MIIQPGLSSPDVQLNLLLQSKHTNLVSSLDQNNFSVWLCGDDSCPGLSSPDVKLNLLSQSKHTNLVSWMKNPDCSLIQNYFSVWICEPLQSLLVWVCGDNSFPALSGPDFKLNLLPQAKHVNPVLSLIQNYFAV